HLRQREQTIGKELEPELAQHSVKAPLGKWQRKRAALTPFDRRAGRTRQRPRNRQHLRIDVDTDDSTFPPDSFGRTSRHDARTARQVQHPFAPLQPCPIDQILGPHARYGGHQTALVEISGSPLQLPLLLTFHRLQLTYSRGNPRKPDGPGAGPAPGVFSVAHRLEGVVAIACLPFSRTISLSVKPN